MKAEVIKIKELLLNIPVGSVITYGDISAAIGRKVSGGDLALQRAINDLYSEQVVLMNIFSEGYKRLNHDDAQQFLSNRYRRRLRKNNKTTRVRLSGGVDFTSLSKDQQNEYALTMMQTREIDVFVKESNVKKLLENNDLVSEEKTLLLMKKAANGLFK